MSYDNTNRGQIWGNDQKQTDTQPDFKGSINVEGKEYWISAWKRKPDANPKAPALSFSVQPKDGQQSGQNAPQGAQQAPAQQGYAPPQQSGQDDFDQEIPF